MSAGWPSGKLPITCSVLALTTVKRWLELA
jgi:hypothetical protein